MSISLLALQSCFTCREGKDLVNLHTYLSSLTIDRTGGKFDQLTGSKVTETILSQLDEGGVDLLVGQLQEMFCDPISAIISEDR